MNVFNIREDLAGRPLAQQVEIMWISGPTWHDADMIAPRLGITKEEVMEYVNAIAARQVPARRRKAK